MTKARYRIAPYLIFTIISLVIALFSYYTVWLCDDLHYGYNCSELHKNQPIKNLSDIIVSQNAHYFNTNGRYFAHCLIQLFCGILGRWPFALMNAIVYVAFICLLCKITGTNISNSKSLISMSIMALLSFMTKMMPSCQICYVWMFVVVLLWLYIFFYKKDYNNWLICLFAGLLSVIAGNGQEGLSIGICAAGLIYWLKNRHDFTPLQYAMAIGFGIGTLLNCLAPSTFNRTEHTGGLVVKLFALMNLFIYGRAVFVLIIVIIYRKLKFRLSWKQLYYKQEFWWNVLGVLILFNVAIGFPSNRAMFGIELISVIILFNSIPQHRFTNFWLAVGSVLFVAVYLLQGVMIYRHYKFHIYVEQEYANSRDGIVYADFDNYSLLPVCNRFIGGYKAYVNGCVDDFEHVNLARDFRNRYHHVKDIRVLPKFLLNTPASNSVREFTDGYWLCVRLKSDTTDFQIHREVGIPPLTKQMAQMPVPFSNPAHSTEQYDAKIILEEEYKVTNLCKVTVQ